MRFFNWEITVRKVNSFEIPWVYYSVRRRQLAKKADKLAHKFYHKCYYISRIKAVHSILDCGLKGAKNWVEHAYADRGKGEVL